MDWFDKKSKKDTSVEDMSKAGSKKVPDVKLDKTELEYFTDRAEEVNYQLERNFVAITSGGVASFGRAFAAASTYFFRLGREYERQYWLKKGEDNA